MVLHGAYGALGRDTHNKNALEYWIVHMHTHSFAMSNGILYKKGQLVITKLTRLTTIIKNMLSTLCTYHKNPFIVTVVDFKASNTHTMSFMYNVH